MCHQNLRQYTCGCLKPEHFHQCRQLQGTPYRCENITKVTIVSTAPFPCATHLTPLNPVEIAGIHGLQKEALEEEEREKGEEGDRTVRII
ncbi:hypothetical protein E6O75_ATG01391 [Venturia nashicola]|uniref:Uncharacterized protein n=1 Tax=Venturia nashicola TaxID=86259 RepID=A0A4Z1PBY9_9PEZI|nr:hypothetical protein E6O75_ATG01391 [Venturia nashicola]